MESIQTATTANLNKAARYSLSGAILVWIREIGGGELEYHFGGIGKNASKRFKDDKYGRQPFDPRDIEEEKRRLSSGGIEMVSYQIRSHSDYKYPVSPRVETKRRKVSSFTKVMVEPAQKTRVVSWCGEEEDMLRSRYGTAA